MALEVSLGVAVYPQHGHDKHALIQHAEAAMLEARRTQRTVVVHDQGAEAETPPRHLRGLRAAIEDNLLSVEFLPKRCRLNEAGRGRSPGAGTRSMAGSRPRFLRLAEQSGLILPPSAACLVGTGAADLAIRGLGPGDRDQPGQQLSADLQFPAS